MGVMGGPPARRTRGGRNGQAQKGDTLDDRGMGHVSEVGSGDGGDKSRERQRSFE